MLEGAGVADDRQIGSVRRPFGLADVFGEDAGGAAEDRRLRKCAGAHPAFDWCPSEMAISDVREIDSSRASGSFSGTDSWLSVRVMKMRSGLPSQAALYMTDEPSGANLASRIVPRSNVSCWNRGVPFEDDG